MPKTEEKQKIAKANKYFDHKDFKQLQKYINQYGQIEPRKRTGLREHEQRRLATAIKRARHLALLPFVANNS